MFTKTLYKIDNAFYLPHKSMTIINWLNDAKLMNYCDGVRSINGGCGSIINLTEDLTIINLLPKPYYCVYKSLDYYNDDGNETLYIGERYKIITLSLDEKEKYNDDDWCADLYDHLKKIENESSEWLSCTLYFIDTSTQQQLMINYTNDHKKSEKSING
jgi:hypothetical protein